MWGQNVQTEAGDEVRPPGEGGLEQRWKREVVSLCAASEGEACQDQGVSEATRSSVEGAKVGDSKETWA